MPRFSGIALSLTVLRLVITLMTVYPCHKCFALCLRNSRFYVGSGSFIQSRMRGLQSSAHGLAVTVQCHQLRQHNAPVVTSMQSLEEIPMDRLHHLYSRFERSRVNKVLWTRLCNMRGNTSKNDPEVFLKNMIQSSKDISTGSVPAKLHADTVNIFIKDAIENRRDLKRANRLFTEYFLSRAVLPSARSLNVMIEAYRNAGNTSECLRYFSYFSLFAKDGLVADSFTFSSMVRVVESSERVLDIIALAAKLGAIQSPPLIRCAMVRHTMYYRLCMIVLTMYSNYV